VRDPIAAQTRLAADKISNVHILTADITDVIALKHAAEEATCILGGRGLNVLINNAAYVSEVTSLKSFRDLYG
jgi:NAD(P)-dependent dehydrogenase (short-subunit alcohol dehydrogenase family)